MNKAELSDKLVSITVLVDQLFNGRVRSDDEKTVGVVIMAVALGEGSPTVAVVSNGGERRMLVRLLRESADRLEREPPIVFLGDDDVAGNA